MVSPETVGLSNRLHSCFPRPPVTKLDSRAWIVIQKPRHTLSNRFSCGPMAGMKADPSLCSGPWDPDI